MMQPNRKNTHTRKEENIEQKIQAGERVNLLNVIGIEIEVKIKITGSD